MAETATAVEESDSYASAVSDLRSTAKWILGAFAAVGTTAFAGLQLTSFGEIDQARDGWRIPLAICGFVIALTGIGLAVMTIGRFLAREPLTLRRLVSDESTDLIKARESLANDRTILGQFTDIAAVDEALEAMAKTVSEASDVLAGLPDPPGSGVDPHAASRLQAQQARTVAQANFLVLQSLARNALGRARLMQANRQYTRALSVIVLWVALAAVGAMVFAVATGQPDAPEGASVPVIDAALATDGSVRTLTVKVSGDGVDHDDIGTVRAAWDNGDLLFEGSFGEEEGLAAMELEVPIAEGRHGEVEIAATLTDGSDDETLSSSMTLVVSALPTTTSTTSTVPTATVPSTTTSAPTHGR